MVDGMPEVCNCSSLRQASRHLTRFYDAALTPAGVGVNQYTVLVRLGRHGPQAQGELAQRLVMDRSTLGHLLRPLERRGLVDVGSDPGDRRRKLLSLTEPGERLLAAARPLWAAAQRRFEDEFGPANAQDLRVTLMNVTNVPLYEAAPQPQRAA